MLARLGGEHEGGRPDGGLDANLGEKKLRTLTVPAAGGEHQRSHPIVDTDEQSSAGNALEEGTERSDVPIVSCGE
jgi:hypothetical protein